MWLRIALANMTLLFGTTLIKYKLKNFNILFVIPVGNPKIVLEICL